MKIDTVEKLIEKQDLNDNLAGVVNNSSSADLQELEKRIDKKIENKERIMFDNIDNV